MSDSNYQATDPSSGRRLLFWLADKREAVPLETVPDDVLIENTKRLRLLVLTETLTKGESIATECVKFLGIELERRGLSAQFEETSE